MIVAAATINDRVIFQRNEFHHPETGRVCGLSVKQGQPFYDIETETDKVYGIMEIIEVIAPEKNVWTNPVPTPKGGTSRHQVSLPKEPWGGEQL